MSSTLCEGSSGYQHQGPPQPQQIPSPPPKWAGLEKPRGKTCAWSFAHGPCQPGAQQEALNIPQQLTLLKDLLPELQREAGKGEAQVGGHQLQDLGSQQVPDLADFLQSHVLEHCQQQGETFFNLQGEKESPFAGQDVSMPKVPTHSY